MPATRHNRSVKKFLYGLLVALVVLSVAEGVARVVREAPEEFLVAEPVTGPAFILEEGRVTPVFQGAWAVPDFEVAPSGTRVAFLGASSVRAGTPELSIDQEFPALVGDALGVEALNLGVPGATAEDLDERFDAVLGFGPSAIVLYSGHNAFVTASQKGLLDEGGIWAGVLLRRSRLALWMSDHIGTQRHAEAGFAFDEAMRDRVRSTHVETLQAMVRRSSVPVLLVTVVSNPFAAPIANDCPSAYADIGVTAPHFGAEARPPNLMGVTPEMTANWALECEQGAYLHARALWESGRLEEGRAALDAIRDTETLPMRADSPTNVALRAVEGVVLVDADRAFREHGLGLEPSAWWHDAVHPNALGHEALAAVIAPELAATLGIEDPGLAIPSTAGP